MGTTSIDATRCATHVRRTVSHLHRKLRPSLQHAGISTAKLSVVGQILRARHITPTELAAREGVKIQTLTRLLSELEADGWLHRVPDESDGRQSLLSITSVGKKRLADVGRATDSRLAAAIQETLQAADVELLLRACDLLERLDEALGGGGASERDGRRALKP
jgi:DNA-binding MarR family transcriptional regulator